MSEELLVRRIKAALDVAPADPALRSRVIASLPLDRRQSGAQLRPWAPAVAVALAVAIVLGLVWSNPFRTSPGRHLATVPLADCELPVFGFAPYQAGTGQVYEAGFLDLSTSKFTPVPLSIAPADQTRVVAGNEAPAISYDRPAGTWVPVKSSWVAPDGMSYAYLDGSDLHLRAVRSQADRVLLSGKPMFLIGWSGGSIYFATRNAYASDLWVVDPASGASHRVLPMQAMSEWWTAGPNAIWGSPYYSGTIARYDTKTHAVSSWTLSDLVELVGLDSSGHPIVLRGDRTKLTGALAVMQGNGNATSLDSADDQLHAVGLIVIADGDRIWLSSSGQRLWVYSPDTGLLSLDQSANSSLPNGLVVAGGCVSHDEVRAQAAPAG